MAKDLFIIRHAKSDWDFDVSDFDRPLSRRGFINAPQMADRLSQYPIKPQQLVSSPAKRAITTAQVFAEKLGIPVNNIQSDARIYEAHPKVLIQIISELDNSRDRIALFGHNPGFAALANYLSDEDSLNMPTCSIVHIHFDDADDWTSVSGGAGQLAWFAYPKEGE